MSDDDKPTVVWESALKRCMGREDLLVEILHLFLAEESRLLDQMDRAMESGDATLLEHAAHQFKGMSGSISALRVNAVSRDIERLASDGEFGLAAQRRRDLDRELLELKREILQRIEGSGLD